MFTFLASLALSVSLQAAPVAPKCETYAPRLDGVSVTVCDGHVTKMTDAAGNVVDYSAR